MKIVAELEALIEAGKGVRSRIYRVAKAALAYIRKLESVILFELQPEVDSPIIVEGSDG